MNVQNSENMEHIVVLDGYTVNPGDLSWEGLSKFGSYKVYDNTEESEILQQAKGASILIVNKVQLRAETIKKLSGIKYIAVSATGYNNVDIESCNNLKIPVSNVRNYGSKNVAQHTFALILEITNQVGIHDEAVRNGKWSSSIDFCFWEKQIVELNDKVIGIIGFGNIGRALAKIAHAFDMKVVTNSNQQEIPEYVHRLSTKDLIVSSDIISLHTHLTEQNKYMVDKDFLDKMKSSAILINTSRGDLINEKDLKLALEHEKIRAAGLDVLSIEPPTGGNILIGCKNCFVTPHNAWAAVEARQRMINIIENNIDSFLKGKAENLVTSF